jgi:hypothetical protein
VVPPRYSAWKCACSGDPAYRILTDLGLGSAQSAFPPCATMNPSTLSSMYRLTFAKTPTWHPAIDENHVWIISALGRYRSTQRKAAPGRDDEAALTADIAQPDNAVRNPVH